MGVVEHKMYIGIRRKYKFLAHLSDVERGYIAGIIDGEGSICSDRIKVANTDKQLLEWLQLKLGGCIHNKKTYRKNHAQSYTWDYSTIGSEQLLILLLPYLIVKRQKAIEYLSLRKVM